MKYQINGSPFPVVSCYLCNNEAMVSESGGMAWMSPNIEMKTTTNGGVGKALGRAFSNDRLFQNIYTCHGEMGEITFSSCFPGDIRVIEVKPGKEYICGKGSFLCSTPGVEMSICFANGVKSGLFGGEGFVLQKFSGQGLLFIEIGGSTCEYDLKAGERIVVGTGHFVMMDDTCKMTVSTVKGAKNVMLGGEGLFNTVIEGPGKVILQSRPHIVTTSA